MRLTYTNIFEAITGKARARHLQLEAQRRIADREARRNTPEAIAEEQRQVDRLIERMDGKAYLEIDFND